MEIKHNAFFISSFFSPLAANKGYLVLQQRNENWTPLADETRIWTRTNLNGTHQNRVGPLQEDRFRLKQMLSWLWPTLQKGLPLGQQEKTHIYPHELLLWILFSSELASLLHRAVFLINPPHGEFHQWCADPSFPQNGPWNVLLISSPEDWVLFC